MPEVVHKHQFVILDGQAHVVLLALKVETAEVNFLIVSFYCVLPSYNICVSCNLGKMILFLYFTHLK